MFKVPQIIFIKKKIFCVVFRAAGRPFSILEDLGVADIVCILKSCVFSLRDTSRSIFLTIKGYFSGFNLDLVSVCLESYVQPGPSAY